MEIDISGLELYMAKSAVCLTVFYLLYWLLFRQITFFPLNRAYLLLGLIGSFVIPQSTLAILSTADNFNLPELMNTEPLAGLNYQSLKQEIIQQGQVDVTRFLELAYRCGLAFMIMKFVFSLTRMLWIVRRAKTISSNSLKVTTASSNAFTFFHLIILPEGETNPLILEHEKAHISQWHWIDLVLMELTVAAMWFNPFVYLYRYAVRLQLEYLADERVIKLGSSQHEYLRCLWSHISKNSFSTALSNSFSKSLKPRIQMLTQRRSASLSYLRYMALLPILSLLVFLFSCELSSQETHEAKVKEVLNKTEDPFGSPVDVSKVTGEDSGFGMRMNPFFKKVLFHTGYDLRLPEGELVMSTADGIVVTSTEDRQKGKYIVVRHSDSYVTSYWHLQRMIVAAGAKVKRGEVIGYVGSTGWSTGPHLHYEVLKDGKNVDPADYLPKKK